MFFVVLQLTTWLLQSCVEIATMLGLVIPKPCTELLFTLLLIGFIGILLACEIPYCVVGDPGTATIVMVLLFDSTLFFCQLVARIPFCTSVRILLLVFTASVLLMKCTKPVTLFAVIALFT